MIPSMLYIFIPLIFGYFIPVKNSKHVNLITQATGYLVFVILAFMGLSLANLDNLAANLNHILTFTIIFLVCISAANFACLPILDHFMNTEIQDKKKRIPFMKMIMESIKLVLVVGGGLGVGLLWPYSLDWVNLGSEMVLLVLLFLVGIQLGNSGISLKQVLLNPKGISIALVVLCSSLIGGAIAAWLLDIPINYGLAMASGFGWYSLAGILMGDALGPVYGGASFLIELSRELIAIVLIPIIISRYPMTAIGYAGATALDFTLPIIQTSGGVKCIPIAIVSGFILSFLVPILILFFVAL